MDTAEAKHTWVVLDVTPGKGKDDLYCTNRA